MRKLVLLILLLALGPAMAAAQTTPILDIDDRTHISANGGAFILTTNSQWSGASLGGALTYNLHQKFSVFGAYDHGFPVNDVDAHLNVWRAVGSLRVHPNAIVGFGYAWFSREVQGGLAQFVVTRELAPRLSVAGAYAHVFSREELADFEYFKVCLNYHLLGKE